MIIWSFLQFYLTSAFYTSGFFFDGCGLVAAMWNVDEYLTKEFLYLFYCNGIDVTIIFYHYYVFFCCSIN